MGVISPDKPAASCAECFAWGVLPGRCCRACYTFRNPPMAHLRAIRLDRIHAELSTGEPGSVNVGTVAARWGFVHGGRFAAAYRRRFGCTPSETARGVPRHVP
jgi:AraC-like DNA-binding protein